MVFKIVKETAFIIISALFVLHPHASNAASSSTEKAVNAAVVTDSTSRTPLPNASIFDCHGKFAGTCRSDGRLPRLSDTDYPITIRYMGFKEKTVFETDIDTIFMQESSYELPEVVYESRQHKVLHMLAYVREYSTLTTYTDTVSLFREKMVDFMLPSDKKSKFKGWNCPRILTSRSYYHFTNTLGLDSVSDRCGYHFSWADWVGVAPSAGIPAMLRNAECGTDTLMGKYSPTEVWVKSGDKVALDVNVMADIASRKWVPGIYSFFRDDIDFEQFRIRFNYSDVIADTISPIDLTGYSFNIESNGRGHEMFMFNRQSDPFFVSTYAEVYIIDKEYITVKEARKWERYRIDTSKEEIAIYEPAEAPVLRPAIQGLVDRVNHVDHDKVRLALSPDERLMGRGIVKQNIGQRVLILLKTATGISRIKSQRNWNHRWKDFREEQRKRNDTEQDK